MNKLAPTEQTEDLSALCHISYCKERQSSYFVTNYSKFLIFGISLLLVWFFSFHFFLQKFKSVTVVRRRKSLVFEQVRVRATIRLNLFVYKNMPFFVKTITNHLIKIKWKKFFLVLNLKWMKWNFKRCLSRPWVQRLCRRNYHEMKSHPSMIHLHIGRWHIQPSKCILSLCNTADFLDIFFWC